MRFAYGHGRDEPGARERRTFRTASRSGDAEFKTAPDREESAIQALEDDGWGSQPARRPSRMAKYRARFRGRFLRPLRVLRFLCEILLLAGAFLFLAVPFLTVVGLFLIIAVGELFFTRLVLELMATSTLESHRK